MQNSAPLLQLSAWEFKTVAPLFLQEIVINAALQVGPRRMPHLEC